MKNWPILIFFLLSFLFLIYSASIYRLPSVSNDASGENLMYAEGKKIWQENNCQSCHQIYGLGGYLGPDITNVSTKYKNNEQALKAIIKSGNKRMPSYRFNESELNSVLVFFKKLDETGSADPRSFKTDKTGMIYK